VPGGHIYTYTYIYISIYLSIHPSIYIYLSLYRYREIDIVMCVYMLGLAKALGLQQWGRAGVRGGLSTATTTSIYIYIYIYIMGGSRSTVETRTCIGIKRKEKKEGRGRGAREQALAPKELCHTHAATAVGCKIPRKEDSPTFLFFSRSPPSCFPGFTRS